MNNKAIKKRTKSVQWLLAVKLITLVLMMVLIYFKIADPEKFGADFQNRVLRIWDEGNSIREVVIIVILMPLNWFIEAAKWQLLVRKKQKISLKEAFKGVITGLSLGFVTPHAIGDYAGRIWQLSGSENARLVGSIWMGKMLQMLATSLFGTGGVYIFYRNSNYSFPYLYLVLGVISVGVIILTVWWFLGQHGNGMLEKIRSYFRIVFTYTFLEIATIFGLAVIRYFVFCTQFVLMLFIFEIPTNTFNLYAGVSWVFLMKSIIPSFNFLSDLGVRELSALTFFDLFGADQSAVVAASLLLWGINILIPSIIGLFFVLKLKRSSK